MPGRMGENIQMQVRSAKFVDIHPVRNYCQYCIKSLDISLILFCFVFLEIVGHKVNETHFKLNAMKCTEAKATQIVSGPNGIASRTVMVSHTYLKHYLLVCSQKTVPTKVLLYIGSLGEQK